MFAKSKQLRVTTIILSCLKYLSEERWLMVSLGDTRFSGAAELGSATANCILLYSLHYQQWFESEAAWSMSLLGVLVLFHISRILYLVIFPLWAEGVALLLRAPVLALDLCLISSIHVWLTTSGTPAPGDPTLSSDLCRQVHSIYSHMQAKH